MIYNNPVDYKIETTPNMFEEILELDNIQAVKESTRNVTNVTNLKKPFWRPAKNTHGRGHDRL